MGHYASNGSAYFDGQSSLPPSFAGDHFMYAASVFGLMTCGLLAAEWVWRLIWAMVEQHRPLKHPVTISRLMLIFLLVGMLMRVGPDIVLVMVWPEVTPHTREVIAYVDRIMDGASAAPMLVSWLIGVLGGPMIDWQLTRLPMPLHLWPTWRQLRRPLRMGLIVLGISLAVTFLR